MLRQEVGVGVRSNVMPSLFCLGYCLTAHMHSMGWSVGSKLGGGEWSNTRFFLGDVYDIGNNFVCVARLPSLSMRQLSGIESCG